MDVNVRNCRSCGRIFNYVGDEVCPSCMKALEEKFEQVKAYIYDNPSANISQVSEDNEVSTKQIKRWIRQERLSFSEESAVGLECENCGAMIKTGRFCHQCKDKMANRLDNMYKEPKKEPAKKPAKDSPKMRFLDSL